MQLSYQTKVVGFIFIVFLSVTAGLILMLNHSLGEQTQSDVERQLSFTSTLLDDQLSENKVLVLHHAESVKHLQKLQNDFHSMSQSEKINALHQVGVELNANRAVVIDRTFSIILDTKLQSIGEQSFPHSKVFSPSQSRPFDMVVPLDDIIYQWIVFPQKSEDSYTWIAVGYDVDKFFKHHLDTISPLNISLGFAYEKSRKNWVVNLSHLESLSPTLKAEIITTLNKAKSSNAPAFTIKKQDQVAMLIPLIKSKETPDITALLLYSFDESFKPYRGILINTLLTFIAAFVIIIFGLTWLNRMFAQKLSDIVDFVGKVDRGNYQIRLPFRDKGVLGQLSSLLNNMIYKIQLRENELIHQTRYDSITELPNKSYFLENVDSIIQENSPKQFMIIVVNIDRFPQINHALGHRVADRLLHHVGARLSTTFAEARLLGKMSGNAFSIMLMDQTPQDAEDVANQILDLFENPFSVYTVTIDLSAHVGFSFYPEDGNEGDTLIQKADVAVFEARHKADHYAIYNSSNDPHQFNKLSLMSELREGLHQNEFEIYFQPKIDLISDKITQAEALIRWHHPYKGLMPPGLFIPMAEETGHIKKLTFWMLKNAFAQSVQWHKKNIHIKISINLSVKDLLNKALMPYVKEMLERYKTNPDNIIFEITESAFMQDPENALKAILSLRKMGFHFSIDDFGTGYSSMSYLKELPVSELKIDMAFIREIASNERDAQIVKSTIELGHSLEISVVAEGIEDEDSVKLLKSFGCDIGQGYYFAKPLPLKEFEEWLLNSKWGISFLHKD